MLTPSNNIPAQTTIMIYDRTGKLIKQITPKEGKQARFF
jgi:antitoxin component YwqK of YwqJK toxin-antitoxin module